MNKKISTPIALSIILVLAVIVGVYTIWQYTEIQKKQTQIQEMKVPAKEGGISFKEVIKEWESYQNSSMGFSINYPNSWKWRDPIEYKKYEGVKATRLERVSRYLTCQIDFVRSVIRDEQGKEVPFKEFIDGEKKALIKHGEDTGEKIEIKEDNVVVDNIPAVKFSYFISPKLSGMEQGMQIHRIFISLKEKETFSIGYYEKKGDYECESIFNQMLSTFKFLE